MQVFRTFEELHGAGQLCAVALGVFDGVHVGHAAVIGEAVKMAENQGGKAVVVTFEPHPIAVMVPERAPKRILSGCEHRRDLMEELGVWAVVELAFDADMAKLTAQEFMAGLLDGQDLVKGIAVGQDWKFGAARSGDIDFLRAEGKKRRLQVCGVAPVMLDGERVSSTKIRELLSDGDLEKAAELLGRPYEVMGEVVLGRQLGRQLGVPTANIDVGVELLPPNGVYVVSVDWKGKQLKGVANLGRKPTVEDDTELRRTLEVHLFDFSKDIYGEELTVQFGRFLRREKKFESVDALKKQIYRDIEEAHSSEK